MPSGIYKILNTVTQGVYIGSATNVKARLQRHLRELRSGKHFNPHLQRSFSKYGELNFSFIPLLLQPIEQARKSEQEIITSLKSSPLLFNVAMTVDHPNAGRSLSPEHKAKIGAANSLALLGRKGISEETRKRLSAAVRRRVRKPLTKESKEKMSIAKLGKPAPWNSYPRSEDTKHKISINRAGVGIKWPIESVDEIRRLRSLGFIYKDISRRLGIPKSTVQSIATNRRRVNGAI